MLWSASTTVSAAGFGVGIPGVILDLVCGLVCEDFWPSFKHSCYLCFVGEGKLCLLPSRVTAIVFKLNSFGSRVYRWWLMFLEWCRFS